MAKIKAEAKTIEQNSSWVKLHNKAIDWPLGMEVPIVKMLHFWEMYAVKHEQEFDSKIGEDYVLGPEWQTIGESIRGLLNGVTGRLDCGTLDSFILQTMREQGFTHLSDGVEEL